MNRPDGISPVPDVADAAGPAELAVLPLPALFRRLNSSDAGLTTDDAAAVLRESGPNQIAATQRKHLRTDLLERFGNPLVLILLFAAAISAFTGDAPSFAIIATIVLVSVILDVT